MQSYLKLKNGRTGKLKIVISGNTIKIYANFELFGDLPSFEYKRFIQTKLSDNGRVNYLKLFKTGIERYWKASLKVFGYKISLSTVVNVCYKKRKSMQGISANRVAVITYTHFGVSCVKYPFFGWRKDAPGNMYLYPGDSRGGNTQVRYSQEQFRRVCAHEFGHIMGVRDLYNKSQKLINKYSPSGERSFMAHQWNAEHINRYDLEKVLTAFKKNRLQDWG